MSNDRTRTERPAPAPEDGATERIARENGISKEQADQLARATGSESEMTDAAGAAARWS